MPSSLETGSGQAFVALITRALRAFHDDQALLQITPLLEWRLVQAAQRRGALSLAEALRAVLLDGLARLQEFNALGASILRRHFIERESMSQVARSLNFSERSVFKHQQLALVQLAQLLWHDEAQARQLARLTPAQQPALDELPPPAFSRLFGVEEALPALHGFLSAAHAHWLVALDGMGGIGKTALARAVTENLIYDGRFERVIWITVQ